MVAMLVIRCPETDREVPTGIVTDLARFERLGEGYATLLCPHCDQHHQWSRRDAYLSILLKPTIKSKRRQHQSSPS